MSVTAEEIRNKALRKLDIFGTGIIATVEAASVTAVEIRNKALRKLGIFGTGTTANSGKADDLDQAYKEVYATLSHRNLVTWDVDEEIPNEFIQPFVALVANARKDEYRIPNDLFQRITLDAQGAIAEIKKVHASDDLDQAYKEVYAKLSRRRLVTWDLDEDIPNEFIQPIVALVADARKDEYAIPNDLFQRITLDARGDNTVINPGAIAEIRTAQASNVYKLPQTDYF